MATIDSRYQGAYPWVCKMLDFHKNTIPTLNRLAEEIFSNDSAFTLVVQYNTTFITRLDLKQQSFVDLTKELDTFNQNRTRKFLLIGSLAVACVVGAIANAVLGFAALGCALTATFNYFPFDQHLNIVKIKAALNNYESTARLVDDLKNIKEIFTAQHAAFENVPEEFYQSICTQSNQHPFSDENELKKRTEFLAALTKELNDNKKLINPENGQIYNASLHIIATEFSGCLIAGEYEQTLASAKQSIDLFSTNHLV